MFIYQKKIQINLKVTLISHCRIEKLQLEFISYIHCNFGYIAHLERIILA